MTLKELAVQYRESAQILKNREEFIKEQIKKGEIQDDLDSMMRLKFLREERYDLIKTANYLENYYSHRECEMLE